MLLLRSPSFVLEHDILRLSFRITRTAIPFSSGDEVDAAYGELFQKLRTFDRTKYVLLMDMRQGPRAAAPGSEIEQAIARNAALMREGWRRVAILMGTAIGVLQATRVKKLAPGEVAVFNDEEAALAYLEATDE